MKLIVILVCFMFPFGALLYIIRKKRNVWFSFLIGMLAFVLSQLCLRLPLLQWVLSIPSASLYVSLHTTTYILILAFTAGLFEEIARWIGFTYIRKQHHSLYDAFAFGFGHGGVEAILLVGIPLLLTQETSGVWIVGVERFFAISFHVCMSIIVWYGVCIKKKRYLFLAIFLHMLLDAYALFFHSTIAIESYIAILTSVVMIGCYFKIIKKVKKDGTISSIL